jgi:hypothetical protein
LTHLWLRAQDLGQVVRQPGGTLAAASNRRLIERGESFAPLLDTRANVLDATTPPGNVPLLDPAELGRALRRAVFINRRSVPGLDEGARLLATTSRTMPDGSCSSSALPARTAPRRCGACEPRYC